MKVTKKYGQVYSYPVYRHGRQADGVGTLDVHGILNLRENVRLKSNSLAYAWVNSIPVWGIGTANLAAGQIRVKEYKA
jgi:hypothetical protein